MCAPPATRLEALGNAIRRRIVELLAAGSTPVGELAAKLPSAARHLQLLEGAHQVTHARAGNRSLFRLDPSGFDAARRWLDSTSRPA